MLKHSIMKSLVTTVLFLAGAATVSRGAAVLLTLQSQPGDFVGAGQSISFAYDTLFGSRVTAAITELRNSKPATVYFQIDRAVNGVGNSLGVLVFDAQNMVNPALVPGDYLGAERAPFSSPGHPGLAVGFQGRGCNTLTGSFTVDKITYNSSGFVPELLTFTASFEQHCDGGAPALRGTIHYELNPVPEPGAGVMAAAGGIVVLGRRGRKLQTSKSGSDFF